MTQALIVASFGTTYADTCKRNISAVEQAVAQVYPDATVLRVFTSSIVRRVLAARGETVLDMQAALDEAARLHVSEVIVVPTHLICGVEYELVIDAVRANVQRFPVVRTTRPLLSSRDDLVCVINAIRESVDLADDEALVLMGHGTTHVSNMTYAAFAYEMSVMGIANTFVGCVEGYPAFDMVCKNVERAGYRKAFITPLMLVAGDHANVDMAGSEPTSWKNRFADVGISARCLLRGLGEIDAVRVLYAQHARDARTFGHLWDA